MRGGGGEYAFADVPTHDDGLDARPSVGANRRAETENAFAVGASIAAAKLADARAKHVSTFHSSINNEADAAVQKARDFIFDADDAPNSLAQLRASAVEVARAKSGAFEEVRDHVHERERHLADARSEQNRRVLDAADRKRAIHAEYLKQEANRRNKTAAAQEAERMTWYHQAERVRQFEMAKMDIESGNGAGPGAGEEGFIKKTWLPVRWLWETWGDAAFEGQDGAGKAKSQLWSVWGQASSRDRVEAETTAADHDDDVGGGGVLSTSETRSIQAATRMEREQEEYEIELAREIKTEQLRRRLMENRDVSEEEVYDHVRARLRARYELEFVEDIEARELAERRAREDPVVAALKRAYASLLSWTYRTQQDHPGLLTTVAMLAVLTMLVWGGTAGAMGHARAMAAAAEEAAADAATAAAAAAPAQAGAVGDASTWGLNTLET